jgi:uncharacterized membrane protein
MATRLRSVAKTITYRLSGSCITAAITMWATEKIDLALGVGLIDVTSKLLFYYLHERVWDHIRWGQGALPNAHVVSDPSLEPFAEVHSDDPTTSFAIQHSSGQVSQLPK